MHVAALAILTRRWLVMGLHHRRRCYGSSWCGNKHRRGKTGSSKGGHVKLVLVAMASALGAAARSHAMAAVAVK